LYASSNISKGDQTGEDEMGGACSMHGRDQYKILVRKPEG